MKEQIKLNEKLQKQEQNLEKFEGWVRRQAEQDAMKSYIKMQKENNEKEEKIKKQMFDEQRKLAADNAFRNWNENKGQTGSKIVKTNSKPTTQTTNKSKDKAFKVPIGPYSNAKGLRDIQKKLNNLNNTEMEYLSDENEENYEEIQEIEEGQVDEDDDIEKEEMEDISEDNKITGDAEN
jgi:hypothetical protein